MENELLTMETLQTTSESIIYTEIDNGIVNDVVSNCFYISIPVFLSIIVTLILTRLMKLASNVGKKV